MREGFRRKKLLREALLHFDLVELGDLGLQEDEFLSDYWRSREDNSVSNSHGDEDVEGKERGANFVTAWGRGNIPDRIKHYIRQQDTLGPARYKTGTPGAEFPEISNPESSFVSDCMELSLKQRLAKEN